MDHCTNDAIPHQLLCVCVKMFKERTGGLQAVGKQKLTTETLIVVDRRTNTTVFGTNERCNGKKLTILPSTVYNVAHVALGITPLQQCRRTAAL